MSDKENSDIEGAKEETEPLVTNEFEPVEVLIEGKLISRMLRVNFFIV